MVGLTISTLAHLDAAGLGGVHFIDLRVLRSFNLGVPVQMKKPTTKNPYKQNNLFRGEAGNFDLNACVGTNGGPYDFLDYARGYVRAGIVLVENAATCDNPVDILVYPIASCFRQAIELYLKYLSTNLPSLWDEPGNMKQTHKLLDNWAFVKGYLCRAKQLDNDGKRIAQAERILTDFVEIDPTGETFRFPADRSGNLFLQNTWLINVGVLGTAMGELGDILDFWSFETYEILQNKHL